MGSSANPGLAFLDSGGRMGALIKTKDWGATSLGHADGWPLSLRSALSIVLNSLQPMFIWWGEGKANLYNDAFIPFLGETKHPAMLGQPASVVWKEVWPFINPFVEQVERGQATWVKDSQYFFDRSLSREEVYVTFGYSPIFSLNSSSIEGLFCACTETTAEVVGERRLSILRDLGARNQNVQTVEAACARAAEVLDANPLDIAFSAIYLVDRGSRVARLAGRVEPSVEARLFPREHGNAGPWPLGTAATERQAIVVDDLVDRLGPIKAPLWDDRVETAVVFPFVGAVQTGASGYLIVGASPRRVFDEGYREFLHLVANQIAASISAAGALEAERERAAALVKLDQDKTAFFSNVSHEFRTPLTLTIGPLEDILARPAEGLAPEIRDLAAVAHRNGRRLLKLVNTLLDFSRVEARRAEAIYEPIDLPRLTTELAANFQSLCAKAGLVLEIDCPPLSEPVYVDREMWEKIVLNLVSNAFKHTFVGGITVRMRRLDMAAELKIIDTGVGIPAPELPRIFERFHRIVGQAGRSIEGSGIGLALVEQLVRLHAGEINVESRPGHGTSFTITLPFGAAHLPLDQVGGDRGAGSASGGAAAFVEEASQWLAPKTAPATVREPPADGERSDRPRIVLADDNADMRAYVATLLAPHYDVEAVSDGAAALEAVRQRPPALVLTDVMMPGLDGTGLLAALRNDQRFVHVPLIMLSARAGGEARAEGLHSGADDYLEKPFAGRELLARVASHIRSSRQRMAELTAMSRLQELSTRLTAAPDLPALLQEVLDATIELQGADFGDVQLYDPTSRTLGIVAHRGLDRRFLDHFRVVDANGDSASGRALRHGERVIVEDVDHDPSFAAHRAVARAAGIRAVQSTPLIDRQGMPLGMLSTHFRQPHASSLLELRLTDLYARQAADVIAVRIAAQRLRDSDTRLRAAADLLGLGLYSWDPQTNVLRWDDTTRAMWGLPPESDVTYELWRSAVHPDDRQLVDAAVERCRDATSGGTFDVEYRVVGHDGVERWVATRGEAHFENGRAIGFNGVALDITDRKQDEEVLRESEERFRTFAENSTDVLWIADATTKRLQYMSPALTRVLGDPTPSATHLAAIVHPEDQQAVSASHDLVATKGEVVVQNYRVVRPDGGVRWINERSFPIRDDEGVIRRIGGIARDEARQDSSIVYVIDADETPDPARAAFLERAGYLVKSFTSARRFIEVARVLAPGCVVLDAGFSPELGETFPKELRALRTDLPLILLGPYRDDVRGAIDSMKAGTFDVLPAPYTPETLLGAVAAALAYLRGRSNWDEATQSAIARVAVLSSREREVLDGLIAGGTNKTIARQLGLSPRTVELHRARVMERLGASTLAEAIIVAGVAGLVPFPRLEP